MSPESLDILDARVEAEKRQNLRLIDLDAEEIRKARRNGEATSAKVTLDDFLRRLEATGPADVEAIALDYQEAAAAWTRADQNRGKAAIRDAGATVAFSRDWISAVHSVRRELDTDTAEDEPERLTTNVVAAAILQTEHFARDEGGNLWVYQGGVYRPDGRRTVRRRTKEVYVDRGQGSDWSRYRADEVEGFILADCPQLLDRPPANLINVLNGIYNLDSEQLEPHSPKFRTPVQLPVMYDPAATCPNTEQFVAAVLPPDVYEASVHWQIVAWILTPDMSVQKALLLLGGGANGKSTWLQQLTEFIGEANVVNKSLQHLETNRFATVSLMGRLANICPDLPSEHLTGTAVFKALTGGDRMHAEYKHGASFDYRPYCKLLFSANDPPRSSDSSEAFYRRWIAIPFPRTFQPHERRPREELDAELSDPGELSGVLNKALQWLPHIREHGLTETRSMRETHGEFRQATDPFAVWADDVLEEHPDALLSCSDARKAYNRRAKQEGWPTMTTMKFGQRMREAFAEIERKQRTWNGDPKTYCYVGIGFSSPDSPTSPSSAYCTEKGKVIPRNGSVESQELFRKDRAKEGEAGEDEEWESEMMERAENGLSPF